jgi:hypothetical protein
MRLVIDLDEPVGECVFEVTAAEAKALRDSHATGKLSADAYELRRIAHQVNNREGAPVRPMSTILGIPARIVDR